MWHWPTTPEDTAGIKLASFSWPWSKWKVKAKQEEVSHGDTQETQEETKEVEKKESPLGLFRLFREGEALPWKGIWFTVEKVNHDTMILQAKTATHNVVQFKKERMRKLGAKR